jgi:hypothetical protein
MAERLDAQPAVSRYNVCAVSGSIKPKMKKTKNTLKNAVVYDITTPCGSYLAVPSLLPSIMKMEEVISSETTKFGVTFQV